MKRFLGLELIIPHDIGQVKSVHEGRGETGVILVQDAHAVYSAQMNWAQILVHLIERYKWDIVCVEGGSRNDSLAYMREYATPEKRKQVAEEFLRAGKITGENYVDLVYEHPLQVWGVERPEDYDAHMAAFTKLNELGEKPVAAVREAERLVQHLLGNICGEEMTSLFELHARMKSGQVSLARYYRALGVRAGFHGIEIDAHEYPNFTEFNRVADLETKINFKTVEAEQTELVLSLPSSVSPLEMTEILRESKAVAAEKNAQRLWLRFHELFQAHPDLVRRLPSAAKYADYIMGFSEIDHMELFQEVHRIEHIIRNKIAAGPPSVQDLCDLLDALSVLGNVFALQATPADWAACKRFLGKGYYDPRHARCVRRNVEEACQFLQMDDAFLSRFTSALDQHALAANFYAIAERRANQMWRKVIQRRDELGRKVAMFVAGGFHTELAREHLLEEAEEWVAVVAPKLENDYGDQAKYREILLKSYVPMSGNTPK